MAKKTAQTKKAGAKKATRPKAKPVKRAAATKTPRKSTARASRASTAAKAAAKKKSPAKKPAAKKTAPARKPSPKKTAPARKAVARKRAPGGKKAAPARKAARKAAPKKAVRRKAAPSKAVRKKVARKKAAPQKAVRKAVPRKTAPAGKAAVRKAAPAKKAPVRRAAPAKKARPTKKAPARKAARARKAEVAAATPAEAPVAVVEAPPVAVAPPAPVVPSFNVQKYLDKLDRLGIKLGLTRIQKLLKALGSPEKKLKIIHIVGTNGKSSTARMISAILNAHGIKTGAYLSPHLVSFNERFMINDREISDQRFEKLILEVKEAAEDVNKRSRSSGPLTQFEILTAAAFLYFHQQKVGAAVIEAGLGGRYDATNVMGSKVQVLTNVELEHTDLLGGTLAEIVREKTAVIPDKGNVVLGALSEEALAEAVKICKRRKAKYLVFGDDFSLLRGRGDRFDVWTAKGQYPDLILTLFGQYQRTNCAVAIQAAELFMRKPLDEKKLRRVLPRITIPARMEVISEKPMIILDGAHNPSGIDNLLGSLEALIQAKRTICVVSILKDKDAEKMLGRLLGFCDILFITENSNSRCAKAQDLANLDVVKESSVQTFVARESQSALESAFKLASIRDVILVTGSLYLLADIKKRMT